jgi:hypothetical protein
VPEILSDTSLGLGRRVVNKWNPWLPEEKRIGRPALSPELIGTAFAPRKMGGEHVPKQISAEATNGRFVST